MIALLAAARAIHFASLMLVFGGSTYAILLRRAGLWPSPPNEIRPPFAIAAPLAIVSGLVWLCLIAGQMSGSWQDSIDPATIRLAATETRFGQIFLGRLIGLAALWFVCTVGRRPNRPAVSILAGLLLISLGPVSHSAAGESDVISVGAISDAAHLLTAGFWLGGLTVLAIFLRRPRADRASLIGALRIFSTWGSVMVAVLVASGLFNAFSILPTSEMSLHNTYFALLLVKVGLATIMVGLASLNRWYFAPAVKTGGQGAVRHLMTSVGLETGLAFLVIGIAGLLGVTAPH